LGRVEENETEPTQRDIFLLKKRKKKVGIFKRKKDIATICLQRAYHHKEGGTHGAETAIGKKLKKKNQVPRKMTKKKPQYRHSRNLATRK